MLIVGSNRIETNNDRLLWEISNLRQSLKGPKGLFAAIVAQAFLDYHSEKEDLRIDAGRFFRSPLYRDMLRYLGFPASTLPKGYQRTGVEYRLDRCSHLTATELFCTMPPVPGIFPPVCKRHSTSN